MGSPKYRAGILTGCALSRTPGDWPPAVPGLGEKQGGQPMATCIACPAGEHPAKASTFVRYGGHPLCKACARTLAAGGEEALPFVAEALKRAIASEPGESRGGPRMLAANDGPSAGSAGAHNPTAAAAPSRSGGFPSRR